MINLYSLKIGTITDFYDIDDALDIIKLAMVFRSEDGTKEGKSQILLTFYTNNKGWYPW